MIVGKLAAFLIAILTGIFPVHGPTVGKRPANPAASRSEARKPAPKPVTPKAYAARLVGPAQWPCLDELWTRESGWNPRAVNPSSGAYGIPQALGHGAVYGANPFDQIRWGLRYIGSRYGNPCNALAHENAEGWY